MPDEVVALARATDALHVRQERDHAEIVEALRALADALTLVVEGGHDRIRAIHAAADTLESSPATSREQADQVRIALDHARVLLAYAEPQPLEGGRVRGRDQRVRGGSDVDRP